MEDQTRALLPAMVDARDQFMELVDDIRPELHRYCARMTGSIFDGEDVVQETLAKAYYALGQMVQPPNLKPWLFRIAHNTAMDFLKRYERQHVEPVPDVPDRAEPEESGVDPALVEAALTVFAELPPTQRSAAILKDVLGQSLEETAQTMGTTVGAVKAALSRARANIARAPRARLAQRAQPVAGETLMTLRISSTPTTGMRCASCLQRNRASRSFRACNIHVRWTQDTTIAMPRIPKPKTSARKRASSTTFL
jgi:RNA polymerase sigma factor (sigma-70 family)